MSTQLKLRRGTTTQHSTFTGAEGEITVDTTKDTIVVHDGATAGGVPLAKESAIAGFATDSAVVHKTGDETVGGVKTLSSNPILSSGTANGVAYLNGSKVLTTGSALTFDGTVFANTAGGITATNSSIIVGSANANKTLYLANYANTSGNWNTIYSSSGLLNVFANTTDNLAFGANGTEQMRLTTAGLGIGTSSPELKLDVAGDILINNNSYLYGENSVGGNSKLIGRSSNDTLYVGDSAFNNPTIIQTGLNYVGIHTNNTERMRIDSSGNVGIGTSSPATKLHLSTGVAEFAVAWEKTGSKQWVLGSFAGGAYIQNATDSKRHLQFLDTGETLVISSGSERMRIDPSGNLLVGTTTKKAQEKVSMDFSSNVGEGLILSDSTIQNGTTFIAFYASTSRIGAIVANGTTNVSYNTSSDYRLKENIQPMQNALTTVAQLNPVTYTWKADGSDGQGFIAHELQAVVPDCVTGEKDAVDAEGKPVYQGIDTSFLVATLTKAIQEQQELINQLTARVTQLEGN